MSKEIEEILHRVEIASKGQRNTEDWNNCDTNLSCPDDMSYMEYIEEAETIALFKHEEMKKQLNAAIQALVEINNLAPKYQIALGVSHYESRVMLIAQKAIEQFTLHPMYK
jgi:C4-dicarboxylate-specific signal transduction histidine kinase